MKKQENTKTVNAIRLFIALAAIIALSALTSIEFKERQEYEIHHAVERAANSGGREGSDEDYYIAIDEVGKAYGLSPEKVERLHEQYYVSEGY